MSRKRREFLYISLLSSLVIAAHEGKDENAKEGFLQVAKVLQDDFCPPFDRASLLVLASDLYSLALCRKRYASERDDERFFSLFLKSVESLTHISSSEYDLGKSEELICLSAKKSRTPQGYLYLACTRSLLFLIGNTL